MKTLEKVQMVLALRAYTMKLQLNQLVSHFKVTK